jgi:predicted DNA-binding transcriptional regulator YafY
MRMLDERREVSVSAAANELGCDRKTVYRDLHVLEQVGVPLYQEERGPQSRWRVVEGPKRRLSLTLSWSEMLALTTGRDLLAGFAGTFFHEAAITALEKIRAALPPEIAARAQAAADVLVADRRPTRDYKGRADLVRTLAEAVRCRETVALAYLKLGAGRSEERVVDPYHLHVHAGAIYLIGYCHRRKDLRTFLLDRAAAVRLTGAIFARRANLDATAGLQGDLGPWTGRSESIRLHFLPPAARLVAERKVHPSQTAQWRQDQSLDVEIKAPITPALERWLLGWAAEVEIQAPAALRARILKRHRAAMDRA